MNKSLGAIRCNERTYSYILHILCSFKVSTDFFVFLELVSSEVSQVMRRSAARVEHAGLNEKQQLAVQRGLQKPFSMVQGPPGTGKTSFLVRFVVSAMSAPRERWQSGRILVCAPSNHAADQILERLISDTDVPTYYITRIYSRLLARNKPCWVFGFMNVYDVFSRSLLGEKVLLIRVMRIH